MEYFYIDTQYLFEIEWKITIEWKWKETFMTKSNDLASESN